MRYFRDLDLKEQAHVHSARKQQADPISQIHSPEYQGVGCEYNADLGISRDTSGLIHIL